MPLYWMLKVGERFITGWLIYSSGRKKQHENPDAMQQIALASYRGGPMAMNNMAEGLIEAGHQVKILAVNSYKYNIDIKQIPEEYRLKTGIELEYINLSINPIHAFLNLFTGKSYHVERFISNTFRKKLISLLQSDEYDIIQLETLFMTPTFPKSGNTAMPK